LSKFERLKQIYDLLGADKIDQKVIGQIDLLLSSTEGELDELISLWQKAPTEF
jgi:hypothetical protein